MPPLPRSNPPIEDYNKAMEEGGVSPTWTHALGPPGRRSRSDLRPRACGASLAPGKGHLAPGSAPREKAAKVGLAATFSEWSLPSRARNLNVEASRRGVVRLRTSLAVLTEALNAHPHSGKSPHRGGSGVHHHPHAPLPSPPPLPSLPPQATRNAAHPRLRFTHTLCSSGSIAAQIPPLHPFSLRPHSPQLDKLQSATESQEREPSAGPHCFLHRLYHLPSPPSHQASQTSVRC